MISAAQIRAARGLLGISAAELADRSGVDWATVQRFENAAGVPKSRSGTIARVKDALEAAGVVFLGDPIVSPGVQLVTKTQSTKPRKRADSN
jgi:transcriptional regulator with XRE-family HTH domain